MAHRPTNTLYDSPQRKQMKDDGERYTPMVSLAKLLNQKKVSAGRPLHELVEGIARTAIDFDPQQTDRFRRTLNQLGSTLPEDCCAGSPDITETLGAVLQALEEHNNAAGRTSETYRNELHLMLSMMTETVASLTTSSGTGVRQLRWIEKSLENAATIDEVKSLRNKLSGCLILVRNESARLQHESERLIQTLKTAVLQASAQMQPKVASATSDPATGLAGPEAAREVINGLLANGKEFTVAVFLIQSLNAVNARYGRAVGDKALSLAAEHIQNGLNQHGQILRWTGPAFVFIADSANNEATDLRIREMGSARLRRDLKVDDQTIPLELTFSWSVQRVPGDAQADAIHRKLDSFVTAQAGKSEA